MVKFLQNFLQLWHFPISTSVTSNFLEIIRNFVRIYSKPFSYFFKIFSQTFPNIFPILLHVVFLTLFYISIKYLVGLLKIFPFSRISFKFHPNFRIFLFHWSYVSSQIFQRFFKINSKFPHNFSKAPSEKSEIFLKSRKNFSVTSTRSFLNVSRIFSKFLQNSTSASSRNTNKSYSFQSFLKIIVYISEHILSIFYNVSQIFKQFVSFPYRSFKIF